MEIIPAIDIIEGKCVRLTEGDYARMTVYNEDPLEVAMQFENAGLKRLHLVDLDGARMGAVRNWKVLERIAGKTGLVIDFGGGIKTEEDVRIVFNSGSAMATVGSIAVKNEPELLRWFTLFPKNRFLIGADVRDEKITVAGWTVTTEINVIDFIEKYIGYGISQFFCTDVSKDGKLEGTALELYKRIATKFVTLHLIASGGVSTMEDLEKLQSVGCTGVIIGKAIYENRIKLSELKKWVHG
jgi:phosphoribosylformimino-5-aminoimidazole carboxamide ribotide isomerase